MRLTGLLYAGIRFRKRPYDKQRKIYWRTLGKRMEVRALNLPQEVQDKLSDVEIEDPLTSTRYHDMMMREIDFVDSSWTPPCNLSDFVPKKFFQEEEALSYQVASRFVCGEQQASVLTKSRIKHALPTAHEEAAAMVKLPENANQKLQLSIMRSHVWANDGDKLPRRFFPHLPIWRPKREFGILPSNQARYLLTDLLRYALAITQPLDSTSLTSRLTSRDMNLSSHYSWHNHRIHFKSKHDLAVCGSEPLPVIESKMVNNEEMLLPDMSPISPLIDLQSTRDYNFEYTVGLPGSYPHPHLVTVNTADLPMTWNSFAEPEAFYTTQEQKNAIGIMSAFSIALASARSRFGKDHHGELPEPVVSQVICCDGVHMDFVCFQLNSLDFSSGDVPRNLAWVDGGHALFEKRMRNRALLRESTYHDLNPDVFKKLLVMFRFGLKSFLPAV